MTFWDFLDRQLARVRAEHVAGAGVFILTGAVFALVTLKPELAKDDLFKTLAQAVVVQGLVGLAMASWFTVKRGGGTATPTDKEPL
jgi:hypothetical protein